MFVGVREVCGFAGTLTGFSPVSQCFAKTTPWLSTHIGVSPSHPVACFYERAPLLPLASACLATARQTAISRNLVQVRTLLFHWYNQENDTRADKRIQYWTSKRVSADKDVVPVAEDQAGGGQQKECVTKGNPCCFVVSSSQKTHQAPISFFSPFRFLCGSFVKSEAYGVYTH